MAPRTAILPCSRARQKLVRFLPSHSFALLASFFTASHLLSIDLLPLIVLHDALLLHTLLDLPRHALQIDIIRDEHVIRVRDRHHLIAGARRVARTVVIPQDGIRNSVRVDHRRRENATRTRRSPSGRVDAALRTAGGIRHATARRAEVALRGIVVSLQGVRVVPQRSHDEVRAKERRCACRYGAGALIERGVC